jgi:hypothetical protein
MLDFPQPLGPTIAEIPLSNFISDGSQNDLKPLIVRFFKNITRPLPQKNKKNIRRKLLSCA